jgi:three-Cys-motif partner protein
MAEDTLPTVWDADPHTIAKLSILKAYLQAWMPILSRQAASQGRGCEVVYIDAFAGPGEYSRAEPGSPLIAVNVAREHIHNFPVPIRMFFVEKRQDRQRHLSELLAPLVVEPPRNAIIETPIRGVADEEIFCLTRDFRHTARC